MQSQISKARPGTHCHSQHEIWCIMCHRKNGRKFRSGCNAEQFAYRLTGNLHRVGGYMEILNRAGRPACFHTGTISRGILAIIATASLILFAIPADAADSIVGKWVGALYQQPVASSSSYPGEFILTSPTSGTSRYPSLNCGGNLSGGESGGVYHFHESIVQGRATATTGGCIDGNIEMIVSGNTMTLRWSGSWNGQDYVVTGTLRRID